MASDRAQIRVLPPFIPLAFLALGIGADSLMSSEIGPAWLARTVGSLCVVVSVVIVLAAARSLAQHRTAFDVRQSTTALVTTGVYRFSRNPVYLAMMVLLSGIALTANSLAMLIASIPAGSALCFLVIRPAEQYLQGKFGSSYTQYQQLARRWI